MHRINPCQMTEDEQFALSEFISQNPDLNVIKKNTFYDVYYNGLEEKFTFFISNDIIRRERKVGKKGFRFEVKDDNIVGAGSYGTVYSSLDTLFLENGFLHSTNKQKKRVIKTQDFEEEQGEAEISYKLPHLHAKPSTFDKDKVYNVSKRMPGEDLKVTLAKRKLTTEQKLQLVLALFQALKRQVIDNNLVHRDIKPANIMVNFKNGSSIPEVNIIDFDFAIEIGKKCNELIGSPVYMAPEIIECYNGLEDENYLCTPALDVYSLCKLICELFLENYSFSKQEEIKLQNLVNKFLDIGLSEQEIKWIAGLGLNDPALFEEDVKFSAKNKIRFKNLLQKMGHVDPKKRPSIDYAIKIVDSICKEEKLYSKLLDLQKRYPVYHMLSCYPHLFKVTKISIEQDEKIIRHSLDRFDKGKLDLDSAENKINQIVKAWNKIEKSNTSPVFSDVMKILTKCLLPQSETTLNPQQRQFKEKVKRDFVIYIKKHMSEMINNQDTVASKRLKAMSDVLEILEKNASLQQNIKDELQISVIKILSPKFETSSLHRNVFHMPRVPFFSKPSRLIRDTMVITRSPVMRCY
ncbi:MAG: protein kinase [Pseudomonadota bacterium]